MNKTIYVKDDDAPIWERAREFAGDKLSPVIISGLKAYVAEKERQESEAKGFERIVLSFKDADDNLIPKKKAFTGKWIISPAKPYVMYSEHGTDSDFYTVAITPKNRAVFFHWTEDREHLYGRHLVVYDSLHDAAANPELKWAAIKAIEEIGVPVEEMDI
jgi:hypothetical protein